jgi:antitoxin MazE
MEGYTMAIRHLVGPVEAGMAIKLAKWGNSLGLRVPAAVAAELGLTAGAEVEVVREGASMKVTPVRRGYTLEELLARVTPDNTHPEVDWGAPVGREEAE